MAWEKRIFIICEGQTEETFVRELLEPYFHALEIQVTASSFDGIHKGNYHLFIKFIKRICKQNSKAYVTTFIDYYAFPWKMLNLEKNKTLKNYKIHIADIKRALQEIVGCSNFIPHLIAHEFESLLLSDVARFSEYVEDSQRVVSALKDILKEFNDNPEDVNHHKTTAPSKRILKLYPHYNKDIGGNLIALEIGLKTIRQKCFLFDEWIKILEKL